MKQRKRRRLSIILIHGVFHDGLFDPLAKHKGKEIFVTEGRPSLQAAQSNARALLRRGKTPTIIADNMAGFLFYRNWVKELWIASQGAEKDGAVCDVGSLIYAVLAKNKKVPVHLYPAKRKTPFLGKPREIMEFQGQRVAARGVKGYVPLVDWVPRKYITGISHE